jgi:hypothetical protein
MKNSSTKELPFVHFLLDLATIETMKNSVSAIFFFGK